MTATKDIRRTARARRNDHARNATDGTAQDSMNNEEQIRLNNPDPSKPYTWPRRILLAVTGLSPQVVTETLYALAVNQNPPFIPTEIHLLTTAEGAERARLALLSNEPGWFHRLCRDYRLEGIDFGSDSIHELPDAGGHPLTDIRTVQDNERAADFITDWLRDLSHDPDTALHISIAGGRKTMGYYAGYALSLFGRSQDRLSHVLVSEPFESSWDFFYPTPCSRVITTRENKLADTRDARITLAEIPFVSVRDGLPKRLLTGNASFTQTVDAARSALESPVLIIDLDGLCIRAGGENVTMTAADLAFYALFARKRQTNSHALRRGDAGLADPYLAEYQRIVGEMSGELERVEQALRHGMDEDYFDQRKSKTNGALQEALGPQLARPYLIQADGRRNGRFALRIEPEAIRFERITS